MFDGCICIFKYKVVTNHRVLESSTTLFRRCSITIMHAIFRYRPLEPFRQACMKLEITALQRTAGDRRPLCFVLSYLS